MIRSHSIHDAIQRFANDIYALTRGSISEVGFEPRVYSRLEREMVEASRYSYEGDFTRIAIRTVSGGVQVKLIKPDLEDLEPPKPSDFVSHDFLDELSKA